ncbi:MAG: OmpA family protein, partial [Bacteroidota bacterium]
MNRLIRMRILVLVVILLVVILESFAQKPRKDYTEGANHFYTERLDLAMPYFEDLANKQFRDSQYLYEIIYLLLIDPNKDLSDFSRLYDEVSYQDTDYFYWLGRIYFRKNQFDSARFFFERFMDESNRWMDAAFQLEVERRIELTEHAEEMMANPGNYDILHLPAAVNSPHADISPAFFEENNELLFMSSRDGTLRGKDFKIFHSVNDEGDWPLNAMLDQLGTFTRDNAKIEMVNEAAKLYIFQPNSGLKYSEGGSSEWSEPQEVDTKITRLKAQSHFYINDKEDWIIFSSAENLKNKGYDLYESRKDQTTGDWSTPIPLPNSINSPEDEDSPYLSPDEKTLYFSSKGHGGMGGKDIFRSEWDEVSTTWQAPENLGYPINSTADEIHFQISQDGKSGYLSSNRLGTLGDFDIYYFWENQRVKLNGLVLAQGVDPISQADVRLELAMSRMDNQSTRTSDSGYYELPINPLRKYRIVISKHGEELYREEFKIQDLDDPEFHLKNFNLPGYGEPIDTRVASTNPPVTPTPTYFKPDDVSIGSGDRLTREGDEATRDAATRDAIDRYNGLRREGAMANVYFRFASVEPTSLEGLYAVKDLLQQQPNVRVQIAGHTDNVGSRAKNMILSILRAQKVKDWLVAAGIDEQRMQVTGYGELVPMATNDDEKEGRDLNRRIEVLLVN